MTLKARITAIDRFIKGLREDGIYNDLQAACVMAGWDSLAGALTPLKGSAPTNANFLDADLDRGVGLTGDGSTKYLDSNRASEEDDQDSHHLAVFQTSPQIGSPKYIAGRGIVDAGTTTLVGVSGATNKLYTRSRNSADNGGAAGLSATGLLGMSRSASDNYDVRVNSNTSNTVQDSQTPLAGNIWVFRSNNVGSGSSYDGTLSFYSIGSATDLALLDARVSTLMADLRAIEETGFDRDAIAYIRAVEEADGAYLETDVKVAVNNLVSGLKADGLWESMASTCLLCGPRTLAGALVPLKGDAPTNLPVANGFVEGDYTRGGATPGLKGDGTSYLDSGRAGDDDPLEDHHQACYATETSAAVTHTKMGAVDSGTGGYELVRAADRAYFYSRSSSSFFTSTGIGNQVGFYGYSRTGATLDSRAIDTDYTATKAAVGSAGINIFVFGYNNGGVVAELSKGRMAFYSIGTSLDLAKLDSHVTAYVTAIGAAV
jgi:hypothetical protein